MPKSVEGVGQIDHQSAAKPERILRRYLATLR